MVIGLVLAHDCGHNPRRTDCAHCREALAGARVLNRGTAYAGDYWRTSQPAVVRPAVVEVEPDLSIVRSLPRKPTRPDPVIIDAIHAQRSFASAATAAAYATRAIAERDAARAQRRARPRPLLWLLHQSFKRLLTRKAWHRWLLWRTAREAARG